MLRSRPAKNRKSGCAGRFGSVTSSFRSPLSAARRPVQVQTEVRLFVKRNRVACELLAHTGDYRPACSRQVQTRSLRIRAYKSWRVNTTASPFAKARLKKLELYATLRQEGCSSVTALEATCLQQAGWLVKSDLLPLAQALPACSRQVRPRGGWGWRRAQRAPGANVSGSGRNSTNNRCCTCASVTGCGASASCGRCSAATRASR